MSYSIAYNSGSTVPFGTYKQGNILMGLKPQEYTVSSGFTWYANATTPNDNYLIISDTYSQGWSTQQESKPTIWRSETGTTDSFVSLVNQLPDVNGVTGFTDSGTAMKYLMDSGKYFVNKDDYLGIVSDGLILNLDAGWYPSYSGSGNTWYGLNNTSYDLTLVNGTSFNYTDGGVMSFDGTNDGCYGTATNDSNIDTEITMEAWFYRAGGNGDRGLILNKENSYEIGVNNSNGQFQWAIYSNAQSWIWLGSSANITNTWVHGVVTRDSNSLEKSYINGVLQSSVQRTSSPIQKINNRINIGGRGGSTSPRSNFGGKIPIVRVYNKALTQSEIIQNYNTQKGRFGL
jgi:hypothetical protein